MWVIVCVCVCLVLFAFARYCCTVKEKEEAGGSHGASIAAKVVGLTCRGGARAATLGEGAGCGCAAVAMVVESTHAPLSGIERSEREREVRDRRVMPMPRCVIN
jgi:hypothetical protein